MIKKIISSGQAGVERAALDVAIKLDIPYGGWIARGRLAGNGILPDTYVLQETVSSGYSESIKKNVLAADGTFILTRGAAADFIKETIGLVERHNRPYLLIDLNKIPILKAATMLSSWVKDHNIEILYVTGDQAGEDLKIYQDGISILESMIYLGLMQGRPAGFIQTPRARYRAALDDNLPQNVNQAVEVLIHELPLKEKIIVANLTFAELGSLQKTLGRYISEKFGLMIGNTELMASCRFVSKKGVHSESEASAVIINKLWDQLRKTHKLRVIK
jgi:hypothetical protein